MNKITTKGTKSTKRGFIEDECYEIQVILVVDREKVQV